jgi:hypothetical protein
MLMGAAAGGGPTLVGYETTTIVATGNATLDVPAGVQDGDLLVIVGGHRGGYVSPIVGWRHMAFFDVGGATFNPVFAWSRRAASEPASYTLPVVISGSGGAYLMAAFRTVGDIQAYAIGSAGAAPSVAGTDGGIVIGLGGQVYSAVNPTGFTGLTAIGTCYEGGDVKVVAAWKELTATEATGTFAILPDPTTYDEYITISTLPAPATTIIPTLVGSAGGSSPDTNTFTVNVPAGVADGDQLVLAITTRNCTVAAPAGWDLRVSVDVLSSEMNYVYTRTASSEPASYTLDPGAGQTAAMIAAFRGVGAYAANAHSTTAPTAAAGTAGGIVVSVMHSSFDADVQLGLSGAEYIGTQVQAADAKVLMAWKPLTITENTGAWGIEATGGMSYDGYSTLTFLPA